MLPSSASCAACGRPAPAWHAALPPQRPRAPLLRRATAARRCCAPDAGLTSCTLLCTPHVDAQQPGTQRRISRGRPRHQWHAVTQRQGRQLAFTASAAASSDSGRGVESTDVVIVGGGLAGLAAGLTLSKAGACGSPVRCHALASTQLWSFAMSERKPWTWAPRRFR